MLNVESKPCCGSRRFRFVRAIIVLSVVLPITIAVATTTVACWEEPLGVFGPGWSDYRGGCLRHGELWYAQHWDSGPNQGNRIRRFDLSTGADRDSGLAVRFHGLAVYPRWIGDTLYLVGWNFPSGNYLFRVDDGIVEQVGLMPADTAMIRINDDFEYEGQPATVIETADGGLRLCHLRDGRWVTGRRIRLPEPDFSDSKTDVDGAEAATKIALKQQFTTRLSVVRHDDQIHLMFVRSSRDNQHVFRAYRNGIEFVDADEVANPHTSPLDPTGNAAGWEPLFPEMPGFNYFEMHCDRKGICFFGSSPQTDEYCYIRRDFDGNWHPANVIKLPACRHDYKQVHFLGDDDGDRYIVRTAWSQGETCWNKAEFFQLDGDSISGKPLVLDRDKRRFELRYQFIFGGLLFAWLIHVGWLFVAICVHEQKQPMYEFGGRSVRLATTSRRVLAFLVDFLVFSSLIAVSWTIQVGVLGVAWDRDPSQSVLGTLVNIEGNSFPLSQWTILYFPERLFNRSNAIGSPRDLADFCSIILLVFLDTAMPLLAYRAFRQGRCGVTPGKWLFGIRVLRSTLHPCGFFRAIVRDVVGCVDFPFMLTPIPAAVSLLLSRQRQRLGDRITDTVVVVYVLDFIETGKPIKPIHAGLALD